MDPNQAIGILIQAAHDGQAKGAYSFQQAEVIFNAIRTLTAPVQDEQPKVVNSLKEKVVEVKK